MSASGDVATPFYRKVARIVAGALLSSDLSDSQLRRALVALENSETRQALSEMLGINSGSPKSPSMEEQSLLGDAGRGDLFTFFYERVRAKKIGLERLRRYMVDANPAFAKTLAAAEPTVQGLLHHFLAFSSEDDAQALLRRIAGPTDEDPYLEGITRKP